MQFKLTVPNQRERLKDLSVALEAVLLRNGLRREVVDDALLIAEEVIANVIDYAHFDGRPHEITVDLEGRGDRLLLSFRDDGHAFDPLAAPEPVLDPHCVDRPIGGLGIHLVRSLCERVHYRREDDHNVLEVELSTGHSLPQTEPSRV